MFERDLMALIEAHRLGGPTYGQLEEIVDRMLNEAPELYDAVIADMRADGALD